MQADVILKEPPPWMPPLSLSGGARVEGGGGARPPPSYAPVGVVANAAPPIALKGFVLTSFACAQQL